MAVTRIIPLHVGGKRSLAAALKKTVDYVKNPEKTDGGQLVTGYRCNSELAAAEFKMDYELYQNATKRSFDPHHSVIAYHLRQSFKPGEITAEEANKIGRELAMRYTHGDHAFLVCTHIDRAHIHNHIIIGAVNLDYTRKLKDVHCSGKVIGKLNDLICLEHGLSVLDHEKCHGGKSYNQWQGYQPRISHRDRLRYAMDEALAKNPTSMEELYRLLMAEGYEIKNRNGENPSFRGKEQERFIRLDTLGANYSMQHLQAVFAGTEKHIPAEHQEHTTVYITHTELRPGNMLIDIQKKLQEGKSDGYVRWAQNFNVKQTAQTLLFLREQGITDYKQLQERIAEVNRKCAELRGEPGAPTSEEYREARRMHMKYKEWLSEWLVSYEKPSRKSRMYTKYQDIVEKRLIPHLGDYELEEITLLTVQRYIAELSEIGNQKTGHGLAPNSINSIITVIQKSMATAYLVGLTSSYEMNKIKRPKSEEAPVECFSLEEQRIIEQAVMRDKRKKMRGIILCLYTGLRIGELLALEWSDIDFQKGLLTVSRSCHDGKDENGKYCRITETPKTSRSRREIPHPTEVGEVTTAQKKGYTSFFTGAGALIQQNPDLEYCEATLPQKEEPIDPDYRESVCGLLGG